MHGRIGRFRTGARNTLRLEALVLFSLSPEALLEAARRSTGERVEVEGPIQLIVYGVPEAE